MGGTAMATGNPPEATSGDATLFRGDLDAEIAEAQSVRGDAAESRRRPAPTFASALVNQRVWDKMTFSPAGWTARRFWSFFWSGVSSLVHE
jgi:hypothetical protein